MKKKLSLLLAIALSLSPINVVKASEFSDTTGHWAENSINEWSDYGIVNGYTNGTFKPSDKITRAEVSALIDKTMKYEEVATNTFEDLSGTEWYADSILKNVEAGNLKGYEDNTVGADRYITRQEVAVMLCNSFDLGTEIGSTNFSDDSNIPEWSKGSIKALENAGYVNGRDGNIFDPKAEITRAEVVTLFDNIIADVYTTAGTYTTDSTGNVLVNAEDVILKDTVVNGNLYISAGVSDGDLTLDNISVTGDVIVEGGGANSVKFTNGTKAKGVKVQKNSDTPVRIFIDENSSVFEVNTSGTAGVKLEGQGDFGTVTVDGTNNIEIAEGTSIAKVVINGGGSFKNNGYIIEVIISEDAKNLALTGSGAVDTLVTDSSSVTVDLYILKVVLGNDKITIIASEKVHSILDIFGNDAKFKIKDFYSKKDSEKNNDKKSSSKDKSDEDDDDNDDDKDDKVSIITSASAVNIGATKATITFESTEAGTYSYTTNAKASGNGVITVGTNTFELTDLVANKNYTVVLKPRFASGNSRAYTIHFTTLAQDIDTKAPVLTNLTSSGSAVLIFTSDEAGTYNYNLNGITTDADLALGENQISISNLEAEIVHTLILNVTDLYGNETSYYTSFMILTDGNVIISPIISNIEVVYNEDNTVEVRFNSDMSGKYEVTMFSIENSQEVAFGELSGYELVAGSNTVLLDNMTTPSNYVAYIKANNGSNLFTEFKIYINFEM